MMEVVKGAAFGILQVTSNEKIMTVLLVLGAELYHLKLRN